MLSLKLCQDAPASVEMHRMSLAFSCICEFHPAKPGARPRGETYVGPTKKSAIPMLIAVIALVLSANPRPHFVSEPNPADIYDMINCSVPPPQLVQKAASESSIICWTNRRQISDFRAPF